MSNSPRKPTGPAKSRTTTSGGKPGTSSASRATGRAPQRSSLSTTWIVGGVIALIVLVAGTIAIVSSGGDDDDTATPTATVVDSVTGSVVEVPVEQTQPVTYTGTPLPGLPDTGSDFALGAEVPVVNGASFDGTPVALAHGTPTLAVFVAHWCPHCQREVPRLVDWEAEGGVPAGVDVIGVSTAISSEQDNYPPSDWLAEEGFPWPVMADNAANDAATAFGVSAFPFFVLYDETGTVVLRTSGEVDTDELTTMIENALGN